MLSGLLDLSVFQLILLIFVLTHLTTMSVSIYLHRSCAHKALELHPVVSHFFRFWLWLASGIDTRAWAAVHRLHHAKCETSEDPHSPLNLGLGKLLLEGNEVYQKAAANDAIIEQYGAGCPDDWIERNVYRKYRHLGLYLMLILNVLLFGALGLTVWAIQVLWMPVIAGGVINGVCHVVGYRNSEVEDASRNLIPFGFLIGGEELHNNHHARPGSARFSVKPYEFDWGWVLIMLLRSLGLARITRS